VHDPVLIIGNKNYSSWSLRPWLLMKVNGIVFDEVKVALYQQHSKAAIHAHAPGGLTPYGKVPILHDGDVRIWDSLAICEYVAERWPHTSGWPDDRVSRAVARAVSAEMHAGFGTLRSELPMNCRRSGPAAAPGLLLQHEIDRVGARVCRRDSRLAGSARMDRRSALRNGSTGPVRTLRRHDQASRP